MKNQIERSGREIGLSEKISIANIKDEKDTITQLYRTFLYFLC